MREIKFRGFNRKNGVWLHGFYLQNRGEHFVCPDEFAKGKSWDDYEVDPDTVGQFTGLCDKNGKEIYEGDVVKTQWNIRPFGIITWHDNGYFFIDDSFGQWKHFSHDFTTLGEMLKTSAGIEAIGNIYDNPELIK